MTFDLREHARHYWENHQSAMKKIDKRNLRDLMRLKLEVPEELIRFHYDPEAARWFGTVQELQFFELSNQLWLRRDGLQSDLRILNLGHLHEILELSKEGEVAA